MNGWINCFEKKDGTIVFSKKDSDSKLKELQFMDEYVVKYKENFNSYGSNPLTESFTISAKAIKMGTGEHINEWV